jgi:hypothetical protein
MTNLKRLLRTAIDGRTDLDPGLLLLAALERIETLETALEPFAATTTLIARATPDEMVLRFGFRALLFRSATEAYLAAYDGVQS